MVRWILAFLVSASLSLGCRYQDPDQASTNGAGLGHKSNGVATRFEFDAEGDCSFDSNSDERDIAAIAQPDWNGSEWCGACAEVTGPKGKVTVRIVHKCENCATGDLGLSSQAYEKIADKSQESVSISWNLVTCDVSGPVKYEYADNSNAHWTALLVSNYRIPIKKVEFSRQGSSFQIAPRNDYNYFIAQSGFGPDPVTVKVTAIDEQVIQDTLPSVKAKLVVDGKSQFGVLPQ